MLKRLALAGLSIGSLVVLFSAGGAGFGVTSVNGVEHVSATSSIRALVAAIVILLAYIAAIDKEPAERPGPVASTSRRAVAWFVDFLVALAALSALLALVPLTVEAIATGHFEWQFERDSATSRDWVLGLIGIGLLFIGMALYWGLPAARGGQTIGQAVL